jgi:hypothetical protein
VKLDIRAFVTAGAQRHVDQRIRLYVFNRRPHPNATRLFVNCLDRTCSTGSPGDDPTCATRAVTPPDETAVPDATHLETSASN